MSEPIATSEPIVKCGNVEAELTLTWSIKIEEFGGKVRASWNSNTEANPADSHLFLYLGNEKVADHRLNARAGEHVFDHGYGRGYRLALMANNYQQNKVQIVSTGTTAGPDQPPPPEAHAKHVFKIELGMNATDEAQLTWSSAAPFRLLESQAHVFVPKESDINEWINQANHSINTERRWGVGLWAAYTADNYSRQRFHIFRTPATRRS